MDIEKDLQQLEVARERRAASMIGIHLEACVQRVEEMTERLTRIMEGSKTLRAAMKPVRDAISQEVERAAMGMLTAVEYTQKAMSKQELRVYVGTHWMRLRTQTFYDFVKDCSRKAGLVDELLEDPDFMNKLFEQVAFRVARDRQQYVPKGKVWINLQNGTLEIGSDGELLFREHRKEDFFTYVLPYAYDPLAECPQWHRFLDRVLPEREMQALLGEYIGYCFTRDMKLEKMAILYGGGQNGKSVTTDVITALLGEENCSHVDLEKLTTDDNHRSLTEGKLANISQENGPNICYSVLKTYVSGEPLMVKTLYKDPKLMYQYGKVIASYNMLPRTENTEGFYRRWLLFPFRVTIRKEEVDIRLKEKLCRELPGILNWVLKALQRLNMNRQFTISREAEEALQQYKLNSNSALRFLQEQCVKDEAGRMPLKELYTAYLRFCAVENVQTKFGKIGFAEQVEKWGMEPVTINHYKHYKLKFKAE